MYFYFSKIIAPLINPTNFLFISIVILLLIYTKIKKKIILNILVFNILILLSISFLPLGNLGLKYLEKDFLDKKKLQGINNIVVLSGSDKRIITSTILGHKFDDSKIYYLGGNAYLVKNHQNDEPSYAMNFYEKLNFDINRVKFVGQSRNTIENLQEIKKLNLDNSKTVLITSASHMKRSMMIAKKLDLDFIPYATDFKSHSQKSFLNKYQTFDVASNLNKFNLFIREIIGIITFKLISKSL